MKRRLGLFPLAVAMATVTMMVGPAGATAASYADPKGDATGAGDPRSDILGVDLSYVGGVITTGVTLANPEAPTTRNWIEGDTAVIWTVFVGEAEYDVNFSSFDDGLYGSVWDEQEKEVCSKQAKAAYGADKRYTVSFPASCLGAPPEVTVTVEMTYDDIASGRGQSEDVGPDDYNDCCAVTPS